MIVNTLSIILLEIAFTYGQLYCYECSSAQSGCGDPIDVRLMHWKRCTGRRVIEDYCVKLIEKVDDQITVTRGCLSDLLLNTQHRESIPQVRRQGYCGNSRDYQIYLLSHLVGNELAQTAMGLFTDQHEDFKRYCFCNDWNGCNTSVSMYSTRSIFVIFFILVKLLDLIPFV
ncbi:Steroid dehydrogenase [Fasciola gigantica]|uniref:Steroid dehydrogenase n=1 Tax=Fasciola gigantica TaxID=46835 RepID=A0A504Z8N5_FASGI|nr:Steroid dehydrogenase [Fasciola gigantica]